MLQFKKQKFKIFSNRPEEDLNLFYTYIYSVINTIAIKQIFRDRRTRACDRKKMKLVTFKGQLLLKNLHI